ncbi:ankyrin repeat family protein [Actinidia rufa]|uniref:Ankyrin repeat family protein n=1 Tax=Actinidia rufa TaxID=165716 RepID=A0A7J0E4I7_9ERIC|nr:ankyrin repeat family protein [Actinidia rufa]
MADGLKPIQVAAVRGNRKAVEILFPLTSRIQTVSEWTVDGILEHMQYETGKDQEETKEVEVQRDATTSKQDMPEVMPVAKKKAAEAKLRGDDAFRQKDYLMAVDAYTQASLSLAGPSTSFAVARRTSIRLRRNSVSFDGPRLTSDRSRRYLLSLVGPPTGFIEALCPSTVLVSPLIGIIEPPLAPVAPTVALIPRPDPRTATIADTSPGPVPNLSHIQFQLGLLQSQLGSLLQQQPSGSTVAMATSPPFLRGLDAATILANLD